MVEISLEQVAALIATPEKVTQNDSAMLQAVVERYPYFQPLRLLLAKASQNTEEHHAMLATAALYTRGDQLHNFLFESSPLEKKKFLFVSNNLTENEENQPEILDEACIDEVDEQEVFDEIGEVNLQDFLADDDKSEQKLVLENIVSTDFFAFQNNFNVEFVPEIEDHESAEAVIQSKAADDEAENIVSKYDDDKLPYTFLWWLAKTRKEHQQIFQPYATPKLAKADAPDQPVQGKANELQQQYVEHIFHLQSALRDEDPDLISIASKVQHKGSDIIENFIRNEPQIRPPKPEQVNNENKARKSAEDDNDLVTETLAKIYIEQMLYDKAIETYQKLSLKFPEKSRYFADLIQSIEKRI